MTKQVVENIFFNFYLTSTKGREVEDFGMNCYKLKYLYEKYIYLESNLQQVTSFLDSNIIKEKDFVNFLFLTYLKYGYVGLVNFIPKNIKKEIFVLTSKDILKKDLVFLNWVAKENNLLLDDFFKLINRSSLLYVLFKSNKISILPILKYEKKLLTSPEKYAIIKSKEISQEYKDFLKIVIQFKKYLLKKEQEAMSDRKYQSAMDELRRKMLEGNTTPTKPVKEKDLRYYTPDFVDGVSETKIRFLPSKVMGDCWYHEDWTHNFNFGDKFYNELCPTTIKKGEGVCPVCDKNRRDWAGLEKEQIPKNEKGRARKRQRTSNILIIEDPRHPENNGKVFLYKYGNEIIQKTEAKIKPPKGSTDKPCAICDLYDGCNFKLKIVKKQIEGKFIPNYKESSFSDSTSSLGDSAFIDSVVSQLYDLNELRDEKRFKTYEMLERNMNRCFGIVNTPVRSVLADALSATVQNSQESCEEENDTGLISDEMPSAENIQNMKFETAEDVFSSIEGNE